MSITLHCCRSLRATTKSVGLHCFDPCFSHAAIFAPTDDRFATAMMFKTVFGISSKSHPVIAREHSDEAIHLSSIGQMDCFASLAMTGKWAVSDFRHGQA